MNKEDLANQLYQVQNIRREWKRKRLPAPLLFNTGDNLAPGISSRFLLSYGGNVGVDAVAQVFALFQYDLIGLGNHEFSVATGKLYRFLKRARDLGLAFAASNLSVLSSHPLYGLINQALPKLGRPAKPQKYFVFERKYKGQTIRVGVFHLLPAKLNADPDFLRGMKLSAPGSAAESIVEQMKKEKPPIDLVVALSHLERSSTNGSEVKQLSQDASGIDLIITNEYRGEDGQILSLSTVGEEQTTHIVSGGKYGRVFGHLKLVLRKEKGKKATLESVTLKRVKSDEEVYHRGLRRTLLRWEAAYCSAWGKPLGKGTIRGSAGMTFAQFNRYVLNFMRFFSRSEVAFINQGLLRKGSSQFPWKRFISRDDLYQSMPFDNHLYVVRLKGSELSGFLSSDTYDGEELKFAGWSDGSVNGLSVENNKYYTVVTIGFLIKKRKAALAYAVEEQQEKVNELRKSKSYALMFQAQKVLSQRRQKLAQYKQTVRKLRFRNCPQRLGKACFPRLRSALLHHFASNGFRQFPATFAPKPADSPEGNSEDGKKTGKQGSESKNPLPALFGPNEIPFTGDFYRLKDSPSWKFDMLLNATFNALFVSPINLETYGEIGAGDPFQEYSARGQVKLNFEVGSKHHVWLNEVNVLYGLYFRSAWDRSRTASTVNPEQQISRFLDEKDDEIRLNTGYKLRQWERVNFFLKYILLSEFSLRRRPDLNDEDYIAQFQEVRYRTFQMMPEMGFDVVAFRASDGSSGEIKLSFALNWRKEFALQMTPTPESAQFKELQKKGVVLRLPDLNHYAGFSVGYQMSELMLAKIGSRGLSFHSRATYKLAFSITPNQPEQPLLLTHEINAEATLRFAITEQFSFDLGVTLYVLRGTIQKVGGGEGEASNLRISGPWAFRIAPNISLTWRWGARGQKL